MSSKTLELEEKTIDGAIERACREFGVPREKLNIEIISEGSNGFLGIGARKAKIRASLLSFDMDFSLNPATPVIRSEGRKEEKNDIRPPVRPDTKTGAKIERKPERQETNSFEPRPKAEHRPAKAAPAVPKPRMHPSPQPAEPKPAQTVEAVFKPLPPANPPVEAAPATSPIALKAKDLLTGLLSRMTFECQVTALETGDTVILRIAGDDSGLLIGRRGQNLDAIQYLLNKAVNRSDAERKMIVVDSEEYRKRREESLLGMAARIREKVKKTQKPLSLAHMNAHDRRIIHLALQEDESIITKSRGEGDYRKIIVLPARKGNAGGSKNRSRQPS